MSTQNRYESKSSRRTPSASIAILAVLFLLAAPSAMARPADSGPAIDTSIVFELIQDLFGELGTFFANSTNEGNTEPTANNANEPTDETGGEQPVPEGGAVLEPFG